MGKDWVYNLSSGEGNTSSSRKTSRKKNSTSTSSTPSSGCMNAVFQLFDLNHYFNFPFNSTTSHTTTIDHPPPLQGVVAPRNSLEIEDPSNMKAAALSSSSFVKNNPQSLHLPMGGIQIKTRVSTDQDLSSSSESAYTSGSPAGTKTPTLVARLMGLDLLPETSSPRPSSSSSSNLSSSKSHLLQKSEVKNKRGLPRNDANTGTRSLPETPRTSSSSTRRSDVDQRFSLQSNKENSQLSGHELEFSKFLTAKIAAAGRQRDENMSPGQYAKQIVKQFKENVSRRVGRDITNTVENRSEQRRDQHVVLLKSKKPTSSNDHKESGSPKLRLSETKNKSITSTHSPKLSPSPLSPFKDNQNESVTVPSRVKVQAVAPVFEEKQIQQNSVCKKVSTDQKYGSRLYMMPQTSDLIRNKQEESFVKSSASSRAKSRHVNIPDKKCKKSTPLSNVPTTLTVKKDPSPPATRLPHQQEGQRQQHKSSESQIKSSSRNGPPSCLSQINMYNQKGSKHKVPHLVTHCNKSNATITGGELYHYISKLLQCTGIHDLTAVSITNWYSPSHPLDPSIFHHLRFSETTTFSQCRLTFDVADEILAGILKPYLNLKPWSSWKGKSHVCLEQPLCGSQLVNTLCGRIRSFPSADCKVLEDIDGLIETDVGKSWESDAYEEEFGDGIVGDVEGDILEGLMHETLLGLTFAVRTMNIIQN